MSGARERPASAWRALLGRRAIRIALLVLFVLAAFAWLTPLLSSHTRDASDFAFGVRDDLPAPPSRQHWLGTDRLFRDQLTRLAHATRLSLAIAVLASAVSAAIGSLVGICAGMLQGRFALHVPRLATALCIFSIAACGRTPWWCSLTTLGLAGVQVAYASMRSNRRAAPLQPPSAAGQLDMDAALMWLVDVGLSFPFLLLVMALAAAFERTTAATLCITLALSGWLGTARLVRARTLALRNADYLVAAQALGAGFARQIWVHVAPQVLPYVIATASLGAAQMVVAESVLSYLGAGVSPPTPTLGHMIYEGQEVYLACPWLLLAPAAVVSVGVYALNQLGEGVRDALAQQD